MLGELAMKRHFQSENSLIVAKSLLFLYLGILKKKQKTNLKSR